MTGVLAVVGGVPPAAVYLVVAVAVLAGSVLLIGAFVPTFTLLLTAGALARGGQVCLPGVIAVAAGAVVAGDFAAHRTGRLLGARPLSGRLGDRVRAGVWRRADALMARRGGQAVLVGRFVPVLRTLVPPWPGPPGCPTAASPPTAFSPPRRGPPPRSAPVTRQRPSRAVSSPSGFQCSSAS
ncbi:hypothetical protein SCATT_04220 [Streptantibioticus cattleyicolor NRRL 8057 = DSM 46488]|uniref:VTT domain-containing protein n=1 Tax=Streptantibioticus cattleyicolor (strain ATCC 35852 / DSM 46488 / JCM 4925 / NBRC 14057 / NRRL 8057) TaxID=1003195 RepID=G8WNN1_STREN|nr:hypothetical protein SCATT_04220 [Streptantibioticus cattleyicolor NRRL 8057 = DSM 46488]